MMIEAAPEISWENTLGAPNGVPFDNDTRQLVNDCINLPMPSPINISVLIEKSNNFPIEFPINTIKSISLKEQSNIPVDMLEFNANSAYPIIHEAMLPLIAAWLKYKRKHGSIVEKALYKNMNLVKFIQRLLDCRAIEFWGSGDTWRLIDNQQGQGGWEAVGTDKETSPLILANCLSYDEIKLSSMMVVSSHSEFINDGSRNNRGISAAAADDDDDDDNDNDDNNANNAIQKRGVIIGVVGSRFERSRVMEHEDMIITLSQNTIDNGYGDWVENAAPKRPLRIIWSNFYGEEYHPLYEEALEILKSSKNKKYIRVKNHVIFDIENYMKRTLLSVEIILLEANTRAEKQNTTAFLHVVGFGLGVWKIMKDQEIYFLKTWEIALKKMNKKLKYVSDIIFSHFKRDKCGNTGNGDYLGDIRIHFSMREPHSKLVRAIDSNKLLVVTYAWDGNAHPGNEFWSGHLNSSGDPAAACSTQIAELHNSRINSRTCGENLHIASPEHGLLHISNYAKLHLA
ncbi:uncharacterized protein LOC122851159 isoform X2 [Aphidius gifuensis]|nr:uncharacterized protein LOC122851159 isoform X2 [Aphidius gifuensis]